jgi:exodeoxyribonuclease VII large subunit
MSNATGLPFDDPPPAPDAPPGGTRRAVPERRIYTVTGLTAAIRGLLEGAWPEVWVEGELSNCRVWNTGHLFFTLKDAGAQIRGFMFKSDLRLLRFRPEDGVQVRVRGRLSVYDQRGEYQVTCGFMEPAGLGARQLALEQLKRTLQAEGLFDPARKRPLPLLPRKIGIVTSLEAAALRDILKVLAGRHANYHAVIRPARVQGDGAALEVAAAIRAICAVEGIDVVIVGRGGGSIEDLWAFNEEPVARAIASARVPVIAAIGHESDVTLADLVADLRAATPSNAAELVVARTAEFSARIDRLVERGAAAARRRCQDLWRRLAAAERRPGYAGLATRVAMRARRLDDLAAALAAAARGRLAAAAHGEHDLRARLDAQDPQRRLAAGRARALAAEARLVSAGTAAVHRAGRRAGELAARLDALSPLAVLARGYAVCWNEDRSRIVADATPDLVGRGVHVRLARGELHCTVNDATPAPAGPQGG